MRQRDRSWLLGLATLLLSLVPAPLPAAEEAPAVPGTIQYLAIGAKNDANVATVVMCTALYSDDVGIAFLDASGATVCNWSDLDFPANNTFVVATQPVDAFPGASYCGDPGPSITGGIVQLGGYAAVRCSAFLIDPVSTPGFAVGLQIYKVN